MGALEGNEGTEDHEAAPLTLEFCWERKAFLELPCLTQILQPGLLPAQGARVVFIIISHRLPLACQNIFKLAA